MLMLYQASQQLSTETVSQAGEANPSSLREIERLVSIIKDMNSQNRPIPCYTSPYHLIEQQTSAADEVNLRINLKIYRACVSQSTEQSLSNTAEGLRTWCLFCQ